MYYCVMSFARASFVYVVIALVISLARCFVRYVCVVFLCVYVFLYVCMCVSFVR